MPKRVRGGEKFKRWVEKAQRNARDGSRPRAEVGFFPGPKYPDGTSVADNALRHEYGLGVPERSFFRRAVETAKPTLKRIIRKELRGRTPVRAAIDSYRDPDTGRAALVDTGRMRDAVEIRTHNLDGTAEAP